MNFIRILFRNLLKGPSTDPFPFGETFTPKGLRGRIEFDQSKCSGCRMCEHVCAGGAIRFDDSPEGLQFTLWHNSCTFCGLCEHYCIPRAIHLTEDWHLAHKQEDKYRMIEQGTVAYRACVSCGGRFIPPSATLLEKVYGGSSATLTELSQRCPDCRRSRSAARLNTPGARL